MLPNINGLGGVITVIIVMLAVLIIYCTVGFRAEAKAKKRQKKAAMRKAAELNFNTVEEYEAYLEETEKKNRADKKQAKKEAKEQVKLAKQAAKTEKVNAKVKKGVEKQAEQKAAANKVDYDINSISGEINTEDIEKLINEQEAKENEIDLAMNVPNPHIEEQMKSFVENAVAQNGEADVQAEAEQAVDLSEAAEAEKTADLAEENQETAEPMAEPKAEAFEMAVEQEAETVAEKTTKVMAAPENIIDESGVETGGGKKIDLAQLKDLFKNAKIIDNSQKDDNTDYLDGEDIPVNPYVHSIPKILNTKEAIAVSQNAPNVTTFYPDGKVVRDNKLVTKRSFYQDAETETEDNAVQAEATANDEQNTTAVKGDLLADDKAEEKAVEPVAEADTKAEDKADDKVVEVTAQADAPAQVKAEELPQEQPQEQPKVEVKAESKAEEPQAEPTVEAEAENLENTLVLPIGDKKAAAATTAAATAATATAVTATAAAVKTAEKAEPAKETADSDMKIANKPKVDDVLMPEKPKAFGYKTAWLAIPNMGGAEVLKALGLKNIAPANWTSGLASAYDNQELFVTPNLNGWTLVAGRALWDKIDLNQSIEKIGWLQKLADSFHEVFYFTTMSDLGNHGWFYIKDGLLVRAYGYSGELDEVMWNFGPLSREEHKLIQGFAMGKTKVVPTEKDVLALAAAWTVDTTFTNDNSRPDIGFVGNL